MSRDKGYDKAVFEQVLAGIRGDNPEHAKATDAEKREAKRIVDAHKKALRRKFNSRQNGGGDVIDTGMFD